MTGTFSYDGDNGQVLKTATSKTELSGRYVMFVITAATTDHDAVASCAEFYLSKDASIATKHITYHYKVDGTEVAKKRLRLLFLKTKYPIWAFLLMVQ